MFLSVSWLYGSTHRVAQVHHCLYSVCFLKKFKVAGMRNAVVCFGKNPGANNLPGNNTAGERNVERV